MSEIRFQCPECKQRMAVETAAVGLKVDCPTCRSTLIVPPQDGGIADVDTRRRLTVYGGTQAEFYEELERTRGLVFKEHERTKAAKGELLSVQRELEKALATQTALNAEIERTKELLAAAIADRDTVATRLVNAEQARESANKAQVELCELRRENATLTALRDEFQGQAEKAESNSSALQARLVNAEKERSELRAHISLLQVQFEESVGHRRVGEEQQQLVIKLQEQVATLTRDRDNLRVNAGHATAELKAARAQLAAARIEADRQRGQVLDSDLQKQTAALTSELSETKRQLMELEKQRGELSQQLDSLRVERDTAVANCARAVATREEFIIRLNERETALKDAAVAVEASRGDLEKFRQNAGATAQERERLQSERNEAAEEARDLQNRVDDLLDQLHARENDLQKTGGKIQGLTGERDEARAQLVEKEAALAKAVAQSAATLVEKERLQSANQTFLATCEQLRRGISEATGRVAAMERDLQARQEALTEAQKALQASWTGHERTRMQLAAAEKLVIENTARLAEADFAARDERRHLERTQQELFAEKAKLRAILEARDGLVEKLETSRCSHGVARDEVAAVRKEKENLLATVARLERQLEELEPQLRISQEERAQAEATLEARGKEVDRLRAAKEELDQLLNTERGKIQPLIGAREKLLQELHAVHAEQDRTAAELTAVRTMHDSAVENLQVVEGKLAGTSEQLAAASEERDQLRTELDQVRSVRGALEQALVLEREKLQPLTQSRDKLAQELQGIRDERDRHAAEAEKLRIERGVGLENLKSLDAKLASTNEELTRAAQERDAVRTELKAATAGNETLRVQRDVALENLKKLEANLASTNEQLAKTTEERDSVRAELQATNAGLERAKQHVSVLQSRRDQLRDEISHLKDALGMGSDLPG